MAMVDDTGRPVHLQKTKTKKTAKPAAEPKVLSTSSRRPPRVEQHGGERDTRSDKIGIRGTPRSIEMPKAHLGGLHETAYRLYMQSQPRPGDKAQQKKAKAAQKALRSLFNT